MVLFVWGKIGGMGNNIVIYNKDGDAQVASSLSHTLGRPLVDRQDASLTLVVSKQGLSLEGDGMVVRGDFSAMLPRIRHLSKEMLAKVVKTKEKGLLALDATAGLGDDSFVLAACGYRVVLYEQNLVIAALLQDALDRAMRDPNLVEIVSRMRLVQGDSISLMKEQSGVSLVYLDPMFPSKKKKSLVNKKLQLIQQLERPCVDDSVLLGAARGVQPRQIVIKRPVKGGYLAGEKPQYSIKGKAIRYDCFKY